MSSSMYEVFNWGHVNESRPKRLSLFLGASEINIDDPPPPSSSKQTPKYATNSRSYGETLFLITHTLSLFLSLSVINNAHHTNLRCIHSYAARGNNRNWHARLPTFSSSLISWFFVVVVLHVTFFHNFMELHVRFDFDMFQIKHDLPDF